MGDNRAVLGRIANLIDEAILDFRMAGQRLTGVYHTEWEKDSGANPVQSSDYPLIRTAVAGGRLRRTDTIVDVGCGMGRFIGYLLLKGFSGPLIGIEIDKTYADFCASIFKGRPNVRIVNKNVLEVAGGLPPESVLYLYNPFSAAVLDRFLSIARGRRLIYANCVERQVFERHPSWVLQEIRLSSLYDGTPVEMAFYERSM